MHELISFVGQLAAAVNLPNFLAIAIGLFVGILIGVLPGMGPLLGCALAIPFTFYMDPVSAMALLIGIYQGGNYGGAISAAVLGIPGTPMAAVTLLEAYPMALRGFASEAVTLACVASFFGSAVSGVLLILLSEPLARIALRFGPAETMAVALLGLTAIGAVSTGSMVKGLLGGLAGLIFAAVGTDPLTGLGRLNFGRVELEGGISLVAMFMGLFGVSELIVQIEKPVRAYQANQRIGVAFSQFKTMATHIFGYIRGTLIGVIIGIIPVVGNSTAGFFAYKVAKDFSKHPENFGKGEPEGVIACESADSACCGGALIPMLAIGIPGDPVVAVMMGGLLIQGLTPGPMLFFKHPDVLTGIFSTFLVGSILLLPMGLASISLFVRVLRTPLSIMLAATLLLLIFGTFWVQRYIIDVWQLWFFGALGYAMRKADFGLAPVAVGFVLGPIFEDNLRRTTIVMSGDFFSYLLSRPIALVIMILVVIALLFPVAQALYLRSRKSRMDLTESTNQTTD